MSRQSLMIVVAMMMLLSSCGNKEEKKEQVKVSTVAVQEHREPKFNFKLTVPVGWRETDTTVEGLHLRLVRCPLNEVASGAVLNVVAVLKERISLDTFTVRNMNYLQHNMEGVVIQGRGSFHAPAIEGRWFSYTKMHNGQKREMVNYILPVDEFAYMITAGCNEGNMSKYRTAFDGIAQSFKMQ